MLTVLLCLGIIGAAPPDAGTGDIIAIAERTVAPVTVPSVGTSAAPIPLNAYQWRSPFDPADRAPYALDWKALLATDEKIASIVRLTMSASGAAIGIRIDDTAGRAPIIATDGKATQLWFRVEPEFQENTAFAGAGVQVAVAVLVRTDATPYKDFERTAVLTVRQQ